MGVTYLVQPGAFRAALSVLGALMLGLAATGAVLAARHEPELAWKIVSELRTDEKIILNLSLETPEGGSATGSATFDGPDFEKRARDFKRELGYE